MILLNNLLWHTKWRGHLSTLLSIKCPVVFMIYNITTVWAVTSIILMKMIWAIVQHATLFHYGKRGYEHRQLIDYSCCSFLALTSLLVRSSLLKRAHFNF